jgi:mono/diheme cytochrome c family protein
MVEALVGGVSRCRAHPADAGRTERRSEAFTMIRIGCSGAMLLAGLALAREATPPAAQTPDALPEGEGQALVARACSQCHSLQVVTSVRLTRKQWEAKIDQMLARGAKLSDEEIDLAAEYLARNFGRPQ